MPDPGIRFGFELEDTTAAGLVGKTCFVLICNRDLVPSLARHPSSPWTIVGIDTPSGVKGGHHQQPEVAPTAAAFTVTAPAASPQTIQILAGQQGRELSRLPKILPSLFFEARYTMVTALPRWSGRREGRGVAAGRRSRMGKEREARRARAHPTICIAIHTVAIRPFTSAPLLPLPPHLRSSWIGS